MKKLLNSNRIDPYLPNCLQAVLVMFLMNSLLFKTLKSEASCHLPSPPAILFNLKCFKSPIPMTSKLIPASRSFFAAFAGLPRPEMKQIKVDQMKSLGLIFGRLANFSRG